MVFFLCDISTQTQILKTRMVISSLELKYCRLDFFEHYVILMMHEGSRLTKVVNEEILEQLEGHYGQQGFILISNRVHAYEIDLDIYKGKVLKNMKGFAVVSKNPEEVKRANIEQSLWRKSFVFFEDINEATDWAKSFF